MKIYLDSTASILEFLYLDASQSLGEVELSKKLGVSDVVVGCKSHHLHYDKLIIINNDHYDAEILRELSDFNEVISRFPLPESLEIKYKLVPYDDTVELLNFEFSGSTPEVMSRSSLDEFVITKSKETYKMKLPKVILNKSVSENLTIIGFISK